MNALSALPPAVLFLMLGAVSVGAVYHLWVWVRRRHDTLHLWAAGWCAITGSYLVSHYVQLSSEAPERVVLASRLMLVCALLIIVVLVGLTQTLVRGQCSRRSIVFLGGLNAVLVLVTLLTNLIATDQVYQRTDRLGGQYWTSVPGPLMVLLAPYIFAVFIYCFIIVWRAKQLDRGERRAFLVAFSVYIAAGLNDSLHAARHIQSIRVFDYAFVAVAFGLTYLAVKRYTRLSESLETEVAAQTRDLRTRQEQLGALVRAGQAVMAGLDLQAVLTRLIEEASRISGAPHVAVLLRDKGSRTLRLAAHMGDTFPPGYELELGQSISGLVAERGEPIYVPNVVDDPRNFIPDQDRASGIVTYLGLPIKADGTILGVLVFKTIVPRSFDPEELTILTSLAHQAAIAIENARLYVALEDRVSRLQTVTRLNRLISSSLDSDRVLHEIVQAAAQLAGAAVASIWIANEEKRTLEVVSFSDPVMDADWPVRTFSFDQGVLGWVARHGRVLNVPDAFKDGRFVAVEWWRRHGLSSFLGVPVILDGVLLAVLTLNAREPFQLDPEDERLLESFGAQAAMAIRNASLYAAEGAARQVAERALAEVKRLQGMLPICSYCKKIRNDQNSWERLESYISEHSHATFSHGICPDCRNTVVARELEQWRRAQ
jgi:GAF domain-containing protein